MASAYEPPASQYASGCQQCEVHPKPAPVRTLVHIAVEGEGVRDGQAAESVLTIGALSSRSITITRTTEVLADEPDRARSALEVLGARPATTRSLLQAAKCRIASKGLWEFIVAQSEVTRPF
jgi:hypothetical protein